MIGKDRPDSRARILSKPDMAQIHGSSSIVAHKINLRVVSKSFNLKNNDISILYITYAIPIHKRCEMIFFNETFIYDILLPIQVLKINREQDISIWWEFGPVTLLKDYPQMAAKFVRNHAQIDEYKLREGALLDSKCIRKSKLDWIACPQVTFMWAHILLPSAGLKCFIRLHKRLLAFESIVCPYSIGWHSPSAADKLWVKLQVLHLMRIWPKAEIRVK